MKRAALKEKSRPAKRARPQNQLALTQTIVRREMRKNTDWKYTDNYASSSNVTSSGSITSLLANLVRGDAGIDNFNGNVVSPQAVLLKYYLSTNQTYNSVRVMVFQWMDASTPVPSGILQNAATTGVATLSATLVTNKAYIKVLHDRTHTLSPSASGDTTVLGYGTIEPVKVYIPGRKLEKIRYNSTANTVQDGNLYILAISDDSVVTYPQIVWYSRVTFADQ